MVDQSFMATALWRHTLALSTRHDEHREQRERLRVSYLTLRDHAAVLLAEADHSIPAFTVHDITHVDALWETASLVCGDSNSLTPAEAYVLGCAFVLHDAAMGLAAYPNGLPETIGHERWRDLLAIEYFKTNNHWPRSDELDSPPDDVVAKCIMTAIRESHATHAARLVDQPWQTSAGNAFYLLQDVQLREAYGSLIGELAASHWADVDVLADQFRQAKGSLPWQPADWIIEPLKLACILRLADATQIDSRRAPTFLFTLRQPQGESYYHWRFQEHISRPQLDGDRVTYTSLRPFGRDAAEAWWLALDYLREVDRELKRVDALLHDLGRSRLAARAVAGVDSPERFAELFPVASWRPIDATLQVSDVPALVTTLGGEQLYGRNPDVAVRELIQNAQDAVLARAEIDPDFADYLIEIRLTEEGDNWFLEVRDNGIGMDEELLVHGLLDFGRSGWSTSQVRAKFPGLAGSGFQPRGRFGIGFFSVFMLGDMVDIITRRYDEAYTDARQLTFNGLNKRPILAAPQRPTRASQGTSVRIKLNESPYESLISIGNDPLSSLVRRLVVANAVPIRMWEPGELTYRIHEPFDLTTGTPEEVFDRLYPAPDDEWRPGHEVLRNEMRQNFAQQATELFDDDQNRIGLAALGMDLAYPSHHRYIHGGIVSIKGLFADNHYSFTGYIEGIPNRASRDRVDFAASADSIRRWLVTQESRMRELGLFGDLVQLELSDLLHGALGELSPDHAIGMTRTGILRMGDITNWATGHEEIFVAHSLSLKRPIQPPYVVIHYPSLKETPLPENWVTLASYSAGSEFLRDISSNRDREFEFARDHRERTWERYWWSISGSVEGELVRKICEAWSCNVRDIFAPIASRGWKDFAYVDDDKSVEPTFGYRLQRPHR